MTGEITSIRARVTSLSPLVALAGERAQTRFWEFFVSNIRNPNTRRAYGRAIGEFLAWCDSQGIASIVDIEPLHVGAGGVRAIFPAASGCASFRP